MTNDPPKESYETGDRSKQGEGIVVNDQKLCSINFSNDPSHHFARALRLRWKEYGEPVEFLDEDWRGHSCYDERDWELADSLGFGCSEYLEIVQACPAFRCLVDNYVDTDSMAGSCSVYALFANHQALPRQVHRRLRRIRRFLRSLPKKYRRNADWRSVLHKQSDSTDDPGNKPTLIDQAECIGTERPAWSCDLPDFSLVNFVNACTSLCPNDKRYGVEQIMAIARVEGKRLKWPRYSDEAVNPDEAISGGDAIFVEFHTPVYDVPIECADGEPVAYPTHQLLRQIRVDALNGFCNFGFVLRKKGKQIAVYKGASNSERVQAVANCPGFDERMNAFVRRFVGNRTNNETERTDSQKTT